MTRPKFEIADVLSRFFDNFQSKRFVPSFHRSVVRKIQDCRTSILGGHLERCNKCSYERPVYNSCRNRYCPKCQTMTKEKWLEARQADLLPVEYFHKVFTLPHELNPLILHNKRLMLSMLFKAVSRTLLQFGEDKRSGLCAKVGFILVLHTWNQQLLDHFHLHCVIAGGGLKETWWRPAKNRKYLFSVKALSIVFKAKFIDLLSQSHSNGELFFPKKSPELEDPIFFVEFLDNLKSKSWVVYSKQPFAGPKSVLNYLGRYTHKVAISNNRIVNITSKAVSFLCRDRKDPKKKVEVSVPGEEFIRRFLLHTLPSGFVRIRHYGFLANRSKSKNLSDIRRFLNVVAPPKPDSKLNPVAKLLELTGIDVLLCPCCKKGRMQTTTGLSNYLKLNSS